MIRTTCFISLAILLALAITGCPAPQHPDVYEGGAFQGDDDDAVGDDDVADDDDNGGMSEEAFTSAYEQAYCDRSLECYDAATLEALGWASVADCLAFFDAAGDDDDYPACTYFSEYAQACLAEVAAVSCDDFITGTWMDACLDTWDCEE